MSCCIGIGATECSLALGKLKDAMMSARTAVKMRPNSSRCFSHLGRVIAKSETPIGRREVLSTGCAVQLSVLSVCVTSRLSDRPITGRCHDIGS